MNSLKLKLSVVLIAVFAIVGGVHAQTDFDGRSSLDRLGAALGAEHYLDAYSEVFMLYDSAPAALIEALAAEPEAEADQHVHVFLSLFSGQPEQALTRADALPTSAFSLAVAAAANSIVGNAEDAADAFSLALERSSDGAQLYGLMAAAAFVKGNPDEILENSSHAVEMNPNLAAAYRLRGIGNLYSGDLEAALLDAERALELDPTTYYFHYLRASIYFGFGDPETAINDINAALALNPRSFIGNAMRAGANAALDHMEQAAQDFASAIDARTNEVIDADPLVSDASAQFTMTFGRTLHLPFEASDTQTLTINVNSINLDEVDPVVLLVSPEGVPLVFNDDASDDTLDAEIADYVLPEGGMYTLVVSHANAGSEGDVEVLLSLR
ncbi:MAG: hypothetical protein IT320_09585 [Anaerolineae bacterium]|nr:hypothetical protein [Anaerolineae bacterium]